MKSHLSFKLLFWIMALALGAMWITACSSQASSTSPSPLGVPEGTYVPRQDEDDLEVKLAGGRFSMTYASHVDAKGPYAATRDLIVFLGEPVVGSSMCRDTEEPGVYKWSLEGNQLVLIKVQDFCSYRVSGLTLQPLIKK